MCKECNWPIDNVAHIKKKIIEQNHSHDIPEKEIRSAREARNSLPRLRKHVRKEDS